MKHLARLMCLIMLTSIVCVSFSGCTDLVYDNGGDYTVGGGEITEDISDIEINWISGSVNVSVGDGDTVKLYEDGSPSESRKLRYLVKNGKLTVQYCKNGRLFWNVPNKDLTLELPKKIAEHLSEIEFDVVSADVSCTGVKAETFKTDSVSGDVTFKGNVSEKVDCETVSGDVEIDGGTFDKGKFDSVSGDVSLYLDEDCGFQAELDSVSGDFKSDFSVVTDGDTYTAGDGKTEISCDTVSGDLTIKQR